MSKRQARRKRTREDAAGQPETPTQRDTKQPTPQTPKAKTATEAAAPAEALQEKAETPSPAEEPVTEAAEEKPKTVEAKEEIEIVEEKIIPINLHRAWNAPRTKRAEKAVRVLRELVKHHMKVDDVTISNDVNELVWARGIKKPPRKIEVRAVKDKEGKVTVFAS